MRLTFLITDLAYGGAETQLVSLATRLKARGVDVQVVSMLPPKAYVRVLEDAGIPVLTLGMRRGVPDPRALFRLVGILRQQRPAIVHSHMLHANLLARIARPLLRVPVLLCTAHTEADVGSRQWQLAYRVTDACCELTTQVSQAGLEVYVGVRAVPRQKIRFVPNAVDCERYSPDPAVRTRMRISLDVGGEFAWLAVGRFEKPKDYPNMLRAFAQLVRARRDAVLLIVGQGSMREEAMMFSRELGLEGQVRFLGVRADVPLVMNAADGYVMSSAWEGMPMVLLEAGAVGLPTVATDVGGNREVVVDGLTGFLVPPKDPDALASAMARMMALRPQERQRMGQAGRVYVEANYSLDRVVGRWEALYGELLEVARS